jgi:S1-C subfamily serine protease
MTCKNLFITALMSGLIACSSMVGAEQSELTDTERAALTEQMEKARLELAEAAQRIARLQQQLVRSYGELPGRELRQLEEMQFDFQFDREAGSMPTRQIVFANFPPRLGVLLGNAGSDEENLVVGVTPGSGAEESGIRRGDRLMSVNGHDVTSDTGARIRELLPDLKAGDTVDVVIARGDDTELVMPVTVQTALSGMTEMIHRLGPAIENIDRDLISVFPQGGDRSELSLSPRLAGLGQDMQMVSNHDGLAPYFGTEDGVIVLRIKPDNSLNLESGDVILSVDGAKISRPVDLGRELIHRQAGEQITIQAMRQGLVTEIYGSIPEQQVLPGVIRFRGQRKG